MTISLTNVNEAPTALTMTGTTTGAGLSAVYNASTDSYYALVKHYDVVGIGNESRSIEFPGWRVWYSR